MSRGILNIVIGGVALPGGLSGRLVLIGTQSSAAFAAIGAAILGLGVYQVIRARS